MLFELTNEQRIYLGLTQVKDSWEKVELRDDIYLYFDNDRLVKRIIVTEDKYHEIELNDLTTEHRTMLLPRTSKGKEKKLNFTAAAALSGTGVYFAFAGNRVCIANFSTQTTFYDSRWENKEIEGFSGLKNWLDWWMKDTTESDTNDIENFRTSVRQRCKYREGDFFVFKTGRRQFGFGRILMDVSLVRKAIKEGKIKGKHYGLMNLMGKSLIIKIYKYNDSTMNVSIDKLRQCEAYYSQSIMDNVFLYGEYRIIGNQPIEPFELEFPISYGRSISARDRDTVYLQYGMIYKEAPLSEYSKYLYDPESAHDKNNPFRNESVGFSASSTIRTGDLRHPQNVDIKREIFEYFGLDADKGYFENYTNVTI